MPMCYVLHCVGLWFVFLICIPLCRCKHRRSSLVAGGLALGANVQLDYNLKFPMFRFEEASIAADLQLQSEVAAERIYSK